MIMENSNIGNLMDVTMTKMREMVDVDTVVGTPITTPDGVTIIPVSKVSYGFAAGGSDFPVKEKSGFGGGNGAGVKVEPVGFLICRDDNVRMINISKPAEGALDRVIEKAPDIIDMLEGLIGKYTESKKEN